ncbi:MAG TPA: adenylate/guanylate cyclase domain-containing protein [Acidimicrobiales bacterium]|nr:adenylate/guanylate cyclase domain-containing protein [Acidimicrobiales bacterium]
MQRSPELEAVARRFRAAILAGDAEGALAFVSHDPSVTFIGSDPNEVWTGYDGLAAIYRAQARELGGKVEETIREVVAHEHNGVGWARIHATLHSPYGPVSTRSTTVWILEGTQWRVIQLHASDAVDNEASLGMHLTTAVDLLAQAVVVERSEVRVAAAPDGTVTLLFTDIEGSTERNRTLGDREWMAILRRHHDLIRRAVADHGGYEVKSMGDGFMLAFSSARTALRCALEIQRAIGTDPDFTVRVRAGLHAGEAVREGNDFYGATVNMAARVAGHAAGGEVLVSSLVKALVESSGEFRFAPARPVELKGLEGVHELHPVAS